MEISDVFGVGEISNYHEIVCKTGEGDICFLEDEQKAEAVAIAINNHDKLVAMLESVVKLQKQHYGDGMTTHIKMMGMSDDISKLLSEINK